ncbi:basic 7S globulin 2-like [Abrus precatorius]|uniref:Basic 7S globulin 2-like n=1 Tax=Abrus precatorius TaxID=3816 RepID=A0A8B8K353_ABRPR|nr:basic 7S globulin 2-like [Abrus precatorius]
MASFAVNFFLFTIALLSIPILSQSKGKTQLRPFILPIEKDPKTNLFYTSVGIGNPRHDMDLVIDLGGPFLWYDCNDRYNSTTYHPIHCASKRCPGGSGCSGCNGPFRPGCSNDTCGAFIVNPFANSIFTGDTGEDVLFLSNTKVFGLLSGCTGSDGFTDEALLRGLPESGKGILGLARTQLALQTQLTLSHNLPRKFALCLPSSNKKGLGNLFIGGAPHISIPHQNVSLMLTTPLIVNPFSTAPIFGEGDPSYEYFIVAKSIKVGGEILNVKSSLLSVDNKGQGGTKISTMNPFTVLHSAIYKPLVRGFVKKASDKKIKRVASVAPFGACFEVSTIGRTITGLDVPTIELELEGGVQWTIYGGNSMVLVNKKVACLGFVDGGKESRTSVVIGGHVLEENLLEFDLVSSKLSFSSSLLLHNARCSSFRS